MGLTERVAALKTVLDAMPGATTLSRSQPRSTKGPLVLDYKVMGKTFAILQVRGFENVILKCDPHFAEVLREQYAGVGHRSHLDRRYWICVSLDADVPADETARLAAQSYDLVRAGLTKKQRVELEALAEAPEAPLVRFADISPEGDEERAFSSPLGGSGPQGRRGPRAPYAPLIAAEICCASCCGVRPSAMTLWKLPCGSMT